MSDPSCHSSLYLSEIFNLLDREDNDSLTSAKNYINLLKHNHHTVGATVKLSRRVESPV